MIVVHAAFTVPIVATTCEICGHECHNQVLSVDHCHKTNEFRGMLCANCNAGLGLFKDNPQALRQAAEYLEKHGR